MRRLIFSIVLIPVFLLHFNLRSDEGMWLPLLVKRLNYEKMKEMGLQLTAEEIYDINNASLKDAIVSLGGFCTGEMISSQGLMLTNHHCGYDAIRSHSTVEKDYLTDGFWAMARDKELHVPGLTASFLVKMEDVTAQVLEGVTEDMQEGKRQQVIFQNMSKIKQAEQEGNQYKIQIKDFFYGNEYYMFVYEVYNDIRLVGAPPSSVGKFGGDTDNWMWPRHTGDFCLFRVYAGADNKPAEYSKDNKPYKPKHHLPISINGIKEGDFTMVFGFPGSTDRYLTSFGVQHAVESKQPKHVEIRGKKLDIMKKHMKASDEVRIKYASTYAQVSNYWKYFIGQSTQLENNNVFEKKQEIEKRFQQWADANNKEKYGNVIAEIENSIKLTQRDYLSNVYIREAVFGSGINIFYWQNNSNFTMLTNPKSTDEERTAAKEALRGAAEEFFDSYDFNLEKEIYEAMLSMYMTDIPNEQMTADLVDLKNKIKGNYTKYVNKNFGKSILTSLSNFNKFLEKPSKKTLDNDPLINVFMLQYNSYVQNMQADAQANMRLEKAMRLFTEGVRLMEQDKSFYPDANSTLRLTYGAVGSYKARDAVHYDYITTIEGILEKMDNTNDEFIVPDKLMELHKKGDYGRYAEDGNLYVCFISNNDITGGNSGSPVINSKGELIGCAFDGNWEAMSGDIYFEPNIQRTISVDVRYILFIIDKYAGASHLIDEMTIVE